MSSPEKKSTTKRGKVSTIIILATFIVISTFILLQMDFIRNLFGLETHFTLNFDKILLYCGILFGVVMGLVTIIYLLIFIYKKIPIKDISINTNEIIQKKKYIPKYRITYILRVKGLPRKDININKEESFEDSFYAKNWDIITSIAQVCDEIAFWIVKSNNRIKLFYSISSWCWFSKDKAKNNTKNNLLALKAAYNNKYPSIKFESSSFQDSQELLNTIKKCRFGLKTRGIPAIKTNQAQIDRLINTLNSQPEDCYYVASFNGIKRGYEKKQITSKILRQDNSNEFEEDFIESKKTGQSKVGVYSFTETETGMHTLLAALLSIWSGTHTFNVEKLNNGSRMDYANLQKLNPMKIVRLSNKAVSSFIHLPEKPYLTEDTGQPVFEIPSTINEKSQNEIKIGNIIQNDKILNDFTLPFESLLFNVEIVGMIGRGKSFLVASIIEQLLNTDLGCLIFDLKGEYADIFVNDPNVIVYTIGNPAPLGINLFQIESNDDVQNVLALVNEMLTIAGTPFSPTMLNIFESALQNIIKYPDKNIETFMQCLYVSSDDYITNMKTSYSRDSIDAILNRLNFIFGGVNYEIFSVLKNTIDFSYLDYGKKIIIDFSEFLRRGANTASLFLVCNLILHLLSKHASQKGIINYLRYLVILEEAMYLIPKRYNLESSASIGYSEQNFIMGRSLGIGTITVYQLWDSVSSVVHANSLTKILFRGEDIEKMKSTITLSEEQFNYLGFLPDRNFIIKSKSLTGPALMKTITFNRLRYTKEEYFNLAKVKFNKNGFIYEKLSKSLMDLRKEIFEKKSSVMNEKEISNQQTIGINNPSGEKFFFKNDFWEWCINSCPIRLEYREKNSNWIKENLCYDLQIKAQIFAKKLIIKENTTPIIEILNNNPKYLVQKILNFFINENNNTNPKLLTYCTINFILSKLKHENNFPNSWKNNILAKVKILLIDESIIEYNLS
ncbi:MAG: DUF87 domain-containing protein [Candidatus Heimdallarchaeota archaeon]|nr:DUF87 domain-containing protein [Candidatus Heimdallarchaeota archaeon]